MNASDEHRLRLTLHYDGTEYHGWQVQPDVETVQGQIERVLERLSGVRVPVIASGRTDTGVHATGQVVSVQMPRDWSPRKLRRALNALLPQDIWVADAAVAGAEFHPRFDAVARTYLYRIATGPGGASPFRRRHAWALEHTLDVEAMRKGAAHIVGDHSFQAFAKSGQPERGDRCAVTVAEWLRTEALLEFRITANRYLHHMVRYLVGTLVAVGRGQRPHTDVAKMLAGATDLRTAPPAPPEGLFLVHVAYPGQAAYHPSTLNAPGFPSDSTSE